MNYKQGHKKSEQQNIENYTTLSHKTWERGWFFLFKNNKIKLTRLKLEEIIRSYKLKSYLK